MDHYFFPDTLTFQKNHTVFFDMYYYVRERARNRKAGKFNRMSRFLLDSRLPEVKVLYVINPTIYGRQDSSGVIRYDTLVTSLYKLDFKKMTSLQTVYLVGDDSDDVIDMPSAFYTTPVKTLHCCCLEFTGILSDHVKRGNPNINVIADPPEDRELILDLMTRRP